jgi:hypothetical protein
MSSTHLGPRSDCYYCQTALSDERTGLSFTIAVGLCQGNNSQPSPMGLMTTFYCLRLESPPTWRARSPYLYPPGTGWPSYTPIHWVLNSNKSSKFEVTLRLAVYRRSVRLGVKILEIPGCFTLPAKSSLYSLDRRLGAPRSRSGRCGKGEVVPLLT